MSQLESDPFNFATIRHPKCPLCDVPMWLVRVMKGDDGGEMHRFECKACGVEAEIPPLD